MHERAGQPAQPQDSIDISVVLGAYHDLEPDVNEESQKVAFGTSGYRGSSLDRTFNEAHIAAIIAAIVEYRHQQGIGGPLFIGCDIHALSEPAWESALEVLAAAGMHTYTDARDVCTPTPSVSHVILKANGASTPGGVRLDGAGLTDDIVITLSHNPPCDGGPKYDPPHDGPAGSDATPRVAARANEILKEGWRNMPRKPYPLAVDCIGRLDFLPSYVDPPVNAIDMDAIKPAGVCIGTDLPGGAAVDYWAAIAERYGLDLTVISEKVDPTWSSMTLDRDGKIRTNCSSPYAMAALRKVMKSGSAPYSIATGNDTNSDRHGIITIDGLMNPNHYLTVAIERLYTHRSGWGEDRAMDKILVSSALIGRVATAVRRRLVEVPAGFKHFVSGLLDGSVGFGGEEFAGVSFLCKDDTVWTTDKDGIVTTLLASEILAVTSWTPSQLHFDQVQRFGEPFYQRVDAPVTKAEKAKLARLTP